MADSDQSINNLRFNQVSQELEGFGGGSPQWTPLIMANASGITQLTGDVTAGPGSGSEAATLATVNSDVGSFTSANITVDAKGRITAATNGSGGGTPAGADTQVQYNNHGAFGADGGLTWDGTTLAVVGNVSVAVVEATDATHAIEVDNRFLRDSSSVLSLRWGERLLDDNGQTTSLDWQNRFLGDASSGIALLDWNTVGLIKVVGSLGVNLASTQDASAVIQADSTTQGVLYPRMTTTQKNAIATPAEGLTVYDTTLHKLSLFTGTVWETVTSA